MRQPIIPPNAAPPLAPYSPGILAGNLIFVSGMLALNKSGEVVGRGDVRAQTEHVIRSVEDVLKAAGASLDNVVMNTIILRDLSDYAAMNEVYGSFFKKAPPARYCFGANLVKPEFLVEIASIAMRPD